MIFYPHLEDAQKGSLTERIEVLMEGAERYKAAILDETAHNNVNVKPAVPRELAVAYNWEEVASVLAAIRNLPESSKPEKTQKATMLTKLAEIYEVLRAAKMPKLEAVRLALISESAQLNAGNAPGI